MKIVLSLGSNLGDRAAGIRRAAGAITRLPNTLVTKRSALYETEPVDVPARFSDKLFINAVIMIETPIPPLELFARLKAIEKEAGRSGNAEKNAPRSIDIDIVCADGLHIDDDSLHVPHPRWAERRFVVQPLAEIEPDLVIPPEKRTVRQILLSLPDSPKVILFQADW